MRTGLFVGIVMAAMAPAIAQASMLDAMSASPDAPAIELSWRGALRGKAGTRIPFLDPGLEQPGWLFDLPFFVELYNPEGSTAVVPYQYWRGRIALEAGYRWALGTSGWQLALKLGAEHESDHPTAASSYADAANGLIVGYVTANDLALSATAQHLGRYASFVTVTNRLHVLSCSVSQELCGEQYGLGGDQTWELEVSLTERVALGSSDRWALFGSVDADVRLGTAQIATERRAVARAGVAVRRATDWFTLSLMALVGSDVGYFRQSDVRQLGVMFGWSPFT